MTELSYDKYNTKAERIYRLDADIYFNNTGFTAAVSPKPLARTLELENKAVCKVTGVIRDLPQQSHFHFSFIRPLHDGYNNNDENEWLDNNYISYILVKPGVSWWIFVVAGSAAMLIALLTVSVQTVRAALANPVKSLRSE